MIEYPITWPAQHGKVGVLDPQLIPWLAEHKYVWITSDAAAKKAHGPLIKKHRLSVLWVRGIQRDKQQSVEHHVGTHDVHRMLTNELESFALKIHDAKGPRHGVVFMNGSVPTLKRVDMDMIDPGNPLKIVGSWGSRP